MKSKNHVTKRRFPNYFWFHPLVLQGPITRWVNNKLKSNTSHLYFIFYITFKSTLLYEISQKHFEIMVAATLGKNLGPPIPKQSNDSISRKTKTCWQHALFLWPFKLMLWISNLFLQLNEITHFQKHINGLLTDMKITRQNLLPYKK